jgi:hypothetical protein
MGGKESKGTTLCMPRPKAERGCEKGRIYRSAVRAGIIQDSFLPSGEFNEPIERWKIELVLGNKRIGEGLFGVKAGIRSRYIGIFSKARPGFFYMSPGKLYIDPQVRLIRAPEEAQSQLRFAMDLGGIVEIYASKRSFVRIDLGDTMINFKRSPWGDISNKDILS